MFNGCPLTLIKNPRVCNENKLQAKEQDQGNYVHFVYKRDN